MESIDSAFWHPRRCFREPASEIFHAAHLLDSAVGAHRIGDHAAAARLIKAADMPAIRDWTESLWGSAQLYPDQLRYLRVRSVDSAPPHLPKEARVRVRMPNVEEKLAIIDRYGRNCLFCGIPLIREEVRSALRAVYADVLSWGGTNPEQHAAFQCMWLQFDHVLPHARGGDNSLTNVVVTCAPCNYGRGSKTLAEVGLIDPRSLPVFKTSWDGLERFLS